MLFGAAATRAEAAPLPRPRTTTVPAVESRQPAGAAGPAAAAAHNPLFYTGSAAGGAARGVALRCIDPEQFAILDEASGKVLEQVEGRKAFYQVYGEESAAVDCNLNCHPQ